MLFLPPVTSAAGPRGGGRSCNLAPGAEKRDGGGVFILSLAKPP